MMWRLCFFFVCVCVGVGWWKQKSADNVELMRWVAALAPRCTDPVEATRAMTISVLARLMTLKGMYAHVADTLAEKLVLIK
jgi:hypothetical protein